MREERGSERRMERGMVVGGEVWRGTRWMGDGLVSFVGGCCCCVMIFHYFVFEYKTCCQ